MCMQQSIRTQLQEYLHTYSIDSLVIILYSFVASIIFSSSDAHSQRSEIWYTLLTYLN